MALADDLNNITPKVHSKTCTVGALLNDLNDNDAVALEATLANDRIAHSDLSRILRDNGFDLAPQTLARHRRQLCRCNR